MSDTRLTNTEVSIVKKWDEVHVLYQQILKGVANHKDIRTLPISKAIISVEDLHDFVYESVQANLVPNDQSESWMKFADSLIEIRLLIADYENIID